MIKRFAFTSSTKLKQPKEREGGKKKKPLNLERSQNNGLVSEFLGTFLLLNLVIGCIIHAAI